MAKNVYMTAVQFDDSRAYTADSLLEEVKRELASVSGYGLDLVVTSEMIQCSQKMDDAETLEAPGPLLRCYTEFAAAENCYVVGSVRLREGDDVHNSAVLVAPDGPIVAYHKVNLTRGEREEGLTPGAGAVVADTPLGRIGFAICFDLNFQSLRQQYAALNPDIVVFPSAWNGGLLQAFWAYECRSYFVAATYYFDSGIFDPYGRPVAVSDEYCTAPMARVNLDYALVHLDFNQDKFADIRRRYGADVTIDIPSHIGSAMVISHSDTMSAMDVVDAFGLVLLDDYLEAEAAANDEQRGRSIE